MDKDGEQEKIMDKAVSIEAKGGKLHLVGLWNDTLDINADIKELSLLSHKIVLEKKSKEE